MVPIDSTINPRYLNDSFDLKTLASGKQINEYSECTQFVL